MAEQNEVICKLNDILLSLLSLRSTALHLLSTPPLFSLAKSLSSRAGRLRQQSGSRILADQSVHHSYSLPPDSKCLMFWHFFFLISFGNWDLWFGPMKIEMKKILFLTFRIVLVWRIEEFKCLFLILLVWRLNVGHLAKQIRQWKVSNFLLY